MVKQGNRADTSVIARGDYQQRPLLEGVLNRLIQLPTTDQCRCRKAQAHVHDSGSGVYSVNDRRGQFRGRHLRVNLSRQDFRENRADDERATRAYRGSGGTPLRPEYPRHERPMLTGGAVRNPASRTTRPRRNVAQRDPLKVRMRAIHWAIYDSYNDLRPTRGLLHQ